MTIIDHPEITTYFILNDNGKISHGINTPEQVTSSEINISNFEIFTDQNLFIERLNELGINGIYF